MKQIHIKPKILYISTDGIMEPLGHSQIFSYLKHLSQHFSFSLMTAEKESDLNDLAKFNLLHEENIKSKIIWQPLKFQSSSNKVKKTLNFINFAYLIFLNSRKNTYSLLHLRSLVSGLLALPTILILRKKFIFDIRGFWIDERADRSNLSRKTVTYKFFKVLENFLLKKSEAIICLTHESKHLLLDQGYSKEKIFVIRTCADEHTFYPPPSKSGESINFVHLGSTHTAYDLMPVLNFFHHFSTKNFKLFVVTRDFTNDEFQNMISNSAFKIPFAEAISLDYQEVPNFLRTMDVGIFFAKENYSIKASFPTKIAEFFATGMPVICNRFNEDILLIEEKKLGLLSDFSEKSLNHPRFEEFFGDLSSRGINQNCVAEFHKEFSNARGIEIYKQVYEKFV